MTDTENNIFTHFCREYADWFPGLWKITHTTYMRQAANLWKIKQELWHMISQNIDLDSYNSSMNSFPVPVCRFARAPRCRSFGDVATWVALLHWQLFAYPAALDEKPRSR